MRPWVLRALVMTLLYGVGQALFVALSSRIVGMTLLWSILLLGGLLLVGLVWGGAEVITDRVPPEWTWLKASFATGPAAGLLTWILLTLFVDAVGVEDLGSALIGRASFTVLLVLASTSLGSWFGWLSLRRSDDPRADRDPGADTDEPIDDADRATTAAGDAGEAPELPSSTADRVAARRARRRQEQAAAAASEPDGAVPAARPSTRRVGSADRGDDPTRVPFGGGPFADPPSTGPTATPSTGGYASPVVAVLPPVTPLPSSDSSSGATGDSHDSHDSHGSLDQGEDAGSRRSGGKRRYGLRRPDDDG